MAAPISIPNPLFGSFDPTDPATTVILQRLAKSLGSGQQELNNNRKHVYIVSTDGKSTPSPFIILDTLQHTHCLNLIGQGPGWYERIGSTVRWKHATIRIFVRNVSTGEGASDAVPINLIYGLIREKIPPTVGLAPSVIAQDANPPASQSAIYTRLGAAEVQLNGIAVRNPLNADFYHIHMHRIHPLHTFRWQTEADFNGKSASQAAGYHIEHRVDLDFESVYLQPGTPPVGTQPLLNAFWLYFLLDATQTGQGTNWQVAYTIDMEFEDVQS